MRKESTKNIYLLLISLGLLSCSTARTGAGKSFGGQKLQANKLKRLSGDEDSSPSFFYTDYKPSRASRSIASVESSDIGEKEAYFLGLWEQKKEMEKLLSSEVEGFAQKISQQKDICPAFHHTLLSAKKQLKFNPQHSPQKNWLGEHWNSQSWERIFNERSFVANPVLALETENGADIYSLYNENGNVEREDVHEAFHMFYQQTQEEIKQLCDTGSSDDFYVFTNMVKFYSGQDFFASGQALEALLKLTPVSNYYVLQSLRSPKNYKAHGFYEKHLLKKLNALWFNHYLHQASASRSANSGNAKQAQRVARISP